MSAGVAKAICSSIMAITGLFVVKNISNSHTKIKTPKNLILLLGLIAFPAIIHDLDYSYMYTIAVYVTTIISYKYILNISYMKSILSCGIMLVFIILLEIIGSCILVPFVSVETIRNTFYINVIINTTFSIILIIIFSKTKFAKWITSFINTIEHKKQTRIIAFFTLIVIAMCIVLYSLTQNFQLNAIFTKNFLVFVIFFLLVMILFRERNDYDKLAVLYDSLLDNVKVFEDWIEKEQLTRHEYKNQLAVLRIMTKDKKVKEKIDSIVEDFISIDDNMITELKCLPNGGMKGLLYYKLSVAKKEKVVMIVDINKKAGKSLSKIPDEKLKVLTKLLGIYIDNAIEAAKDTEDKKVVIEIYMLKELVNIVISNSYDNSKDISNRYQKGVSTKGKGRGNGLYFASELLLRNNWINEQQESTVDFYVQKLIINTKI